MQGPRLAGGGAVRDQRDREGAAVDKQKGDIRGLNFETTGPLHRV